MTSASVEVLDGVRDSKQMTARQRARYEGCIKSASIAWAVGSASEGEIDELGIVPATCLAMRRAIDDLVYPPNHLLIDYISLPDCACPQTVAPQGRLPLAEHRGRLGAGQNRAGCLHDRAGRASTRVTALPATRATAPPCTARRSRTWARRRFTGRASDR